MSARDRGEIVSIDDFFHASAGTDENGNQISSVMHGFRRVTEMTGAAIVIIHHTRKGHASGGLTADDIRGHSSIEASCDLALRVRRRKDIVEVSPAKMRVGSVRPLAAEFIIQEAVLRG
jgi:RecA-family ATPase